MNRPLFQAMPTVAHISRYLHLDSQDYSLPAAHILAGEGEHLVAKFVAPDPIPQDFVG
jgi:hypothetical protein